MTNLIDLIRQWEETAAGTLTVREYLVRLPLRDAARIAALADMYPRRSDTELITDLLTAALDELETAMPYTSGTQVVAEDEEGNPVFADAGPTPRLLELTRKYMLQMANEVGSVPLCKLRGPAGADPDCEWF